MEMIFLLKNIIINDAKYVYNELFLVNFEDYKAKFQSEPNFEKNKIINVPIY